MINIRRNVVSLIYCIKNFKMNIFFIVCMYVLIKFNVIYLFDFNVKDSDIIF